MIHLPPAGEHPLTRFARRFHASISKALFDGAAKAQIIRARESGTPITVTCTVTELREVLQAAGYYVHQAGSHDPAFLSGLESLNAQLPDFWPTEKPA